MARSAIRIKRLADFLSAQEGRQGPKKVYESKALDQVIDMKRAGAAMSSTIGINGVVDLEHAGKGQVCSESSMNRHLSHGHG